MISKKLPVFFLLISFLFLSGCQDGLKTISFNASKITEKFQTEKEIVSSTDLRDECPLPNPHPVAENIAQKYQLEYTQVIDWYCQGYEFEDILLALQTGKITEVAVEDLLTLSETQSWSEIWEDFDLNP